MHILYVSHYFPPEMGAPAARVSELARHWVERGEQVTVLTGFAHHPTGVKAPQDRWKWTRRETYHGVDVVRSYVYATANSGTARRMLSFASFMASATAIGSIRVPRPDIVIGTSPQLLCGCAGYALARRFRVPYVFEVRDLWPESIAAVGAMGDNLIIKGLKRVARYLYHHSEHLVTVGPGYRRQIAQRYPVPEQRMAVIPNGVDIERFVPGQRDNEVRRRYGWGNRFVALYLGTHGMAHDLRVVLAAAEHLRHRDDIRLVLVGDGAEKISLKREAAERGLTNVQFIDAQPRSQVPLFYAAADVGLVTLRDTPLFRDVLPSKIFEYLGMQRPIITNVPGEASRVLQEAAAGWCIEPGSPDRLAESILTAAQDPARLAQLGQNGRRFVCEHYNRSHLADSYLELLGSLARCQLARSGSAESTKLPRRAA